MVNDCCHEGHYEPVRTWPVQDSPARTAGARSDARATAIPTCVCGQGGGTHRVDRARRRPNGVGGRSARSLGHVAGCPFRRSAASPGQRCADAVVGEVCVGRRPRAHSRSRPEVSPVTSTSGSGLGDAESSGCCHASPGSTPVPAEPRNWPRGQSPDMVRNERSSRAPAFRSFAAAKEATHGP
jgi:hypothetical protein